MLRKLFGPGSRAGEEVTDPCPEAPANTRLYVIGDIHGRVDLLRELQAQILEDSGKTPDVKKCLIYLGDYVDRGHDSQGVIDLLIDEPLVDFEITHLCGNHEEMMLAFLDDPEEGAMWLYNGGDATALSYRAKAPISVDAPERLQHLGTDLRAKVPERHLEFLNGLAPYRIEGGYLFVHAGIRPGIPIEEQNSRDLRWLREPFLGSNTDHGYCVVHGHTVYEEPLFNGNRIGIDTGAYFSDILTCLVLEGREQRVLRT
jgi:serine/threonine protein phosphatase 1